VSHTIHPLPEIQAAAAIRFGVMKRQEILIFIIKTESNKLLHFYSGDINLT
jgi:hypothetical protein